MEIFAYIDAKCKGIPLCSWGAPELQIFDAAGRPDGFDACEMLRIAFPQLRNAASQGINGDEKMRFSLAMDFLTPLFGMRGSAFHQAFNDCRAEAVVVTAFIRFFATFNEVIDENV
jgi:hypothetical protein